MKTWVIYKSATGEIVSYIEADQEPRLKNLPAGCSTVVLEPGENIANSSGTIDKKIRLRDKARVPYRVPLINTTKAKILAEIASNTPSGQFVELGCYRGGTALYLLEVAQNQKRDFHVFDTFTGHPFSNPEYDLDEKGDYDDNNLEEVKEYLPGAIFHVGIFPETITDDVKDVAFAYVDMDVYQSTKSFKTHLWDRMVKGGVVYFDDIDLDGVIKAINEDFPGLYKEDRRMNMWYIVKE